MKRIVLTTVIVLFITAGFAAAKDQYRPIRLSITPGVDIPLTPDSNLFQLSGGCGMNGDYVFPFFKQMSLGVDVNYHLGRMEQIDLSIAGSLSIVSAEAAAELRFTVLKLVELYLSGGAGWFYAFLNADPTSTVMNLIFSGGVGIGFRVAPRLTIGIVGEYRRYNSLYHFIGAGLSVDLWLGGEK